jgi:deoxyinosine 3'endonuclease (endonuclease V)
MSEVDVALLAKWRAEQEEIAKQVIALPDAEPYSQYQSIPVDTNNKLFGGVDISFGENESAVAVYVIMKNNEIVHQDHVFFQLSVPYVSSYLAFREIEPLVTLVKRQIERYPELTPIVILVDGNGIFHERRAGIACHLGILTDVPTIGVAKKMYCTDGLTVDTVECGIRSELQLFVEYCQRRQQQQQDIEKKTQKMTLIRGMNPIRPQRIGNEEIRRVCDEGIERGDKKWVEFISNLCNGFSIPIMGGNDEILASALIGHGGMIKGKGREKTCGTKNPIFISIGHNISLENAIQICCGLSLARIPEPIRLADLIGRKLIKTKKSVT